MRKSLREYGRLLGLWGWTMIVVCFLGGATLVADAIWAFVEYPASTIAVVLIAGLVVPFIAFHKLRIQRDAVIKDLRKENELQQEAAERRHTELLDKITAMQRELNNKYHRQSAREQLGRFMNQGYELQRRFRDEPVPLMEAHMKDWDGRVARYLKENLDTSYVDRFRNPAGLLPMSPPTWVQKELQAIWGSVHNRLQRLQAFIAGLT